jgi:hypothetical protein
MVASITIPESLQIQVAGVQQAFELLAGMHVAEARPGHTATRLKTIPPIEATLHYFNGFEGHVSLLCSPSVAYAFTEKAMCTATPTSFTNEVKDALGELINTIGGGFKNFLPAGTSVSLPNVFVADRPHAKQASSSARVSSLDFESAFGPFRITLYADQ